jgi:hypothetical protein
MTQMFECATAFNQPFNEWNMINITDTSTMFHQATSFNHLLNHRDVRNVVNMAEMFSGANSLINWDVSNVKYFDRTTFKQPLGM